MFTRPGNLPDPTWQGHHINGGWDWALLSQVSDTAMKNNGQFLSWKPRKTAQHNWELVRHVFVHRKNIFVFFGIHGYWSFMIIIDYFSILFQLIVKEIETGDIELRHLAKFVVHLGWVFPDWHGAEDHFRRELSFESGRGTQKSSELAKRTEERVFPWIKYGSVIHIYYMYIYLCIWYIYT